MNKSFFDEIKKNSKKAIRDRHHFNLYIDDESQDFWEFVRQAEENGLAPSTIIRNMITNTFNKGILNEIIKEKENENPDTIENMGVVKTLIKTAQIYNKHGADELGSDFSKVLSKKFLQGNMTPNELVDLMTFILELNAVVRRTDIFKKFVRENPGLVLESLREFNNSSKVEVFKQELKNQFFVDIDLFESEKKEAERKEFQRQGWEIRKAEIIKWEADNYPTKWCNRNMTDEEIKLSERIGKGELVFKNGEYILIDHIDESEDDIDDFNDQVIETDISDI